MMVIDIMFQAQHHLDTCNKQFIKLSLDSNWLQNDDIENVLKNFPIFFYPMVYLIHGHSDMCFTKIILGSEVDM